MEPNEIVIELVRNAENSTRGEFCRSIREYHSAYPEAFEKAILKLVQSDTIEERKVGLSAGWHVEWAGIEFPSELVSHLLTLDPDGALEAAANYIWYHQLIDYVPQLNSILSDSKKEGWGWMQVLKVLLQFADKRSEAVFTQVYDDMIADTPVNRDVYQQVQAKWAGDRLSQNIYPLPKQTRGVYLPKGSIGTAFPIDDTQGPICTCCGVAMMCLFRVPREADPLEMPIFHCPRCVFFEPVYLDLNSTPPTWVGSMDAEMYDADGVHEIFDIAGTIAWETDIKGNSDSRTFIGGQPDRKKGEQFFDCPKCSRKMEFVIQLDSEFSGFTNLNFNYHGTVDVHRCRGCNVQAYGPLTT